MTKNGIPTNSNGKGLCASNFQSNSSKFCLLGLRALGLRILILVFIAELGWDQDPDKANQWLVGLPFLRNVGISHFDPKSGD